MPPLLPLEPHTHPHTHICTPLHPSLCFQPLLSLPSPLLRAPLSQGHYSLPQTHTPTYTHPHTHTREQHEDWGGCSGRGDRGGSGGTLLPGGFRHGLLAPGKRRMHRHKPLPRINRDYNDYNNSSAQHQQGCHHCRGLHCCGRNCCCYQQLFCNQYLRGETVLKAPVVIFSNLLIQETTPLLVV